MEVLLPVFMNNVLELQNKLTLGDDLLYSFAEQLIADIEVEKEFSKKTREAVFAEIAARAA